jgi:hypothetical protein
MVGENRTKIPFDFQVDVGTKLFGGVSVEAGGLTSRLCQKRLSCSAGASWRALSKGSRTVWRVKEEREGSEAYISREYEGQLRGEGAKVRHVDLHDVGLGA